MAVNIHNLDGYVRQSIESTGVTTAVHDLGYTVRDRSTGKQYMYIKLAGGVTGVIGAPVGMFYVAEGSAVHGTVTADITDSASVRPVGVLRSALVDLKYGWMEVAARHMMTTVLVDSADVSDEGAYLIWGADSKLQSVLVNSIVDGVPCAKALGSDLAGLGWMDIIWL